MDDEIEQSRAREDSLLLRKNEKLRLMQVLRGSRGIPRTARPMSCIDNRVVIEEFNHNKFVKTDHIDKTVGKETHFACGIPLHGLCSYLHYPLLDEDGVNEKLFEEGRREFRLVRATKQNIASMAHSRKLLENLKLSFQKSIEDEKNERKTESVRRLFRDNVDLKEEAKKKQKGSKKNSAALNLIQELPQKRITQLLRIPTFF